MIALNWHLSSSDLIVQKNFLNYALPARKRNIGIERRSSASGHDGVACSARLRSSCRELKYGRVIGSKSVLLRTLVTASSGKTAPGTAADSGHGEHVRYRRDVPGAANLEPTRGVLLPRPWKPCRTTRMRLEFGRILRPVPLSCR